LTDLILPLNGMPSDRSSTSPDGESFDWGPIEAPDSSMGDSQCTDWAIEQLHHGFNGTPFFMGVGYYRPHIPLWAPAKYFEPFPIDDIQLPQYTQDDLDDLSETGKRWALEAVTAGSHATVVAHDQWRQAIQAYLACTYYVDHEIGRLLQALEVSGLAGNTIIVLWTDHGWHLGEKEHWGKWTGWERSTRVPLIISVPENTQHTLAKPGSRCHQPASLLDLFPTLGELCDIPVPNELDGVSLAPLLREPTQETGRTVTTLFDQGNVSVRNARYRYIRYADGTEELYDHTIDPNEWHNLSADPSYLSALENLRPAHD
jgi:arylsulfatase A-like enzyme